MAWEIRSNGRQYYTRSTRVNGKVVREYVGTGYLAELAAQLDKCEKARRVLDKVECDAVRQELGASEAEIAKYDEQVNTIVNAILTAAGYHRHDRGAWRRKKETTMPTKKIEAPCDLTTPDNGTTQGDVLKAGMEAKPGTPAESRAIECIRTIRKQKNIEDYNTFSAPLLDLMARNQGTVYRKFYKLTIDEECTRLAGPNATPLEKLLTERIVVSQNQLFRCEAQYASAAQKDMSLAKSLYYQKCIGMAQKRYLDAIKALAQIRKLQIPPTLQVNIGEKQINIANTGTAQNIPLPQHEQTPFAIE